MNKFYNKLEYFVNTEGVEPEIYYHYTSVDALFNIVKNHSFRLTNLNSSNDLKELSYDYKEFIKDIEILIEEEKNDTERDILKFYLKFINNDIKEFKKRCSKRNDIYALCLSSKKDNLTHWDRYANNCKGVCIGINMGAFKVYAKRMNNMIFGKNLLSHGKVSYEGSIRRNRIKKQIFGYINYLLEEKEFNRELKVSLIKNIAVAQCAAIFSSERIFTKNSSFIDEDEVRMYFQENTIKESLILLDSMKEDLPEMLYINTRKSFLEMIDKYNLSKSNFYVSKYGIRSFIDLVLREIWGSGLITEIILGPLCVQNKNELKKFINQYGLKGTKISVSDVPIR